MKKYTIQIESNFDLLDIVRVISKYEKIGAVKLLNVIEGRNERAREE